MHEKLVNLQQELKCKKGRTNSFGGYKYRSCDDIFEAVKPLLSKFKMCLTIDDEIVMVGERYYIKATAKLKDLESDAEIEVSAYAREAENKPKMDESQITGTASSYARKYALNGLLLIDDTKDPDTDEYRQQTMPQQTMPQQTMQLISPKQCREIEKLCEQNMMPVAQVLTKCKVQKLEDLPAISAGKVIEQLKGRLNGQ